MQTDLYHFVKAHVNLSSTPVLGPGWSQVQTERGEGRGGWRERMERGDGERGWREGMERGEEGSFACN